MLLALCDWLTCCREHRPYSDIRDPGGFLLRHYGRIVLHKLRPIRPFRMFGGRSLSRLLTPPLKLLTDTSQSPHTNFQVVVGLTIGTFVCQLRDELAELNAEAAGIQIVGKQRRNARSEGYNLVSGELLTFAE